MPASVSSVLDLSRTTGRLRLFRTAPLLTYSALNCSALIVEPFYQLENGPSRWKCST